MTRTDRSTREQDKALSGVPDGWGFPGLRPDLMSLCARSSEDPKFLAGYLPRTPSYPPRPFLRHVRHPSKFHLRACGLFLPRRKLGRGRTVTESEIPRAVISPRTPSPSKMITSTSRHHLIKIVTGYTSSTSIN